MVAAGPAAPAAAAFPAVFDDVFAVYCDAVAVARVVVVVVVVVVAFVASVVCILVSPLQYVFLPRATPDQFPHRFF